MTLLEKLGLPAKPKVQPTAATGASPGLGDQIRQGLHKQLEDAKASAREALLSGLGTAKGVATQVTEAADTAMWAASEVRDGADNLQKRAHEFVAGPKGSTRRKVVDTLFAAPPAAEQPSMNPIDTLARLSDKAKQAGWVDERGNASISAPMSKSLGTAARWVEEKVGGTPADPEMLSTMDKAELRASVGTQVALAFVGAEEVKLLMNAIGAGSAIKAIVESYRVKGEACFKDPALWSGVIGIGLLMAGIKNTGAAAKLAAAAHKYGWMVAAIPPLTQMCIDALDTKTVDEKERQARVKRNMAAALNIIKDVLLHKMSEASGKTPPSGTPATEGKAPPVGIAPVAPAASQPAAKPVTTPTTEPAAQRSVKPAAKPTAKPAERPAATQPLKGWITEEAPKAANDNVELPPANDNVVPLPKPHVQEVPLAKAAGAENMSAGTRKPPAADAGKPLEVVASRADDSGKSVGSSKGPRDASASALTTGAPPPSGRSGTRKPSKPSAAASGADGPAGAKPKRPGNEKKPAKAAPPVAPKAANDNAERAGRTLTSAEINALPGMQKFINRLDEAHLTLDKLGLTPRQLIEMASSDPKNVAKRLNRMLDDHGEIALDLVNDKKLPRDQQVEEDTPTTGKPNPKPPRKRTEAGNFAHKYAEQLNEMITGTGAPSIDALQPGMRAEYSIPDPRRPPSEWQRVDRIDWSGGVVVEIGPSHLRGQKLTEARNYAAMLDKTHPLGGGRRWQPQVITYNQKQVLAFLHQIGYFE
jgi:hypothetical protein